MAVYAVNYHYDPAMTKELDELRPEHRAYLRTLVDNGTLLAAGAFVAVESPSALLIFRADTEDQVRGCLADDPFQRGGCVTQTVITEWNPVLGVFAEHH